MNRITLTGVDAQTDNGLLRTLSSLSSAQGVRAEWGLLYSPSRAGQPGRYASFECITERIRANPDLELAVHFCGQSIAELVAQGENKSTALLAMLADPARPVPGRAQLNFNQRVSLLRCEDLESLFLSYPAVQFIVQYNQNNAELVQALASRAEQSGVKNLAVLFDASGGRGVLPAAHPDISLTGGLPAGYAGGFSPANIAEQTRTIAQNTNGQAQWVDLESALRDESDVFCLHRCQETLKAFATAAQALAGQAL